MRKYNQYTQDILDYNNEHGTDIFLEYKRESTSDERKKEIEDWLFTLLRERGEVPKVLWNDTEVQSSLCRLSEIRLDDIYRNGDFYPNNCGVDVLYHFFPELDDVKKKGSPKSIRDTFNDDRALRTIVRKALQYSNNELGIYRMFFWCGAGNSARFRPTASKSLYEMYGVRSGCRVLDSSVGYGSEVLGAHFADNVSEFVGIDPNTAESCKNFSDFLVNRYDTGTSYKFLKIGSEDFTKESFPEYQNYFDIFFTSPPYFNTEQYSDDETQSYKKFPTYIGWIKGFYQETIHNVCNALKSDGVFCINIFNKIPRIDDITRAFLADNGWYIVRTDRYLMRNLPGARIVNGERVARGNTIYENWEPIYVAYHYSRLFNDGMIDRGKAFEYKSRAVRDNKRFELS